MRAIWPILFATMTGSAQQATRATAITTGQIRLAASRAVAIVQRGATGFYKSQNCFSCHSVALPMMTFETAREHGVPVDEVAVRAVAVKGLLEFPNRSSVDAAIQDFLMVNPAFDDGWALIGMHAAGVESNLNTAVYTQRLASLQQADGHWLTADQRPPQAYSSFTATALVVRAMQLHMASQRRQEAQERSARAKKWLLAAEPRETEDYTFRLFGLFWAGASAGERGRAARDLIALQKPDGGWSQLPHMQPDAYATGEALVALHEAGGLSATDPIWQKGLRYLVTTQDSIGAWRVRTRMISPAPVSPPYFEAGFPYEKDQFLSMSGTCWAAMALLAALPKVARPAVPLPLPELSARGIEPWMATALFGTVAELKALLDGGLDPNSKTAEGTSLLMMAVRDVNKVKLLISRGADVGARAKTGFTALTVASTYGGTSESLKELLQKELAVKPKMGVLFNASPLLLAVIAGDRDNLALLLSRGADVQQKTNIAGVFPVSPLSMAAAFGNTELIKVLLEAGADVHEKDQNEMTLLHWAVLRDHPDTVKLLVSHGANVNAVDAFGYTPLLYASTVDFGDAKTTIALLEAGADPNIKDKAGKMAWDHSGEYPYIRTVLEKVRAKE
jgi:ankyrin repeat protein